MNRDSHLAASSPQSQADTGWPQTAKRNALPWIRDKSMDKDIIPGADSVRIVPETLGITFELHNKLHFFNPLSLNKNENENLQIENGPKDESRRIRHVEATRRRRIRAETEAGQRRYATRINYSHPIPSIFTTIKQLVNTDYKSSVFFL